MKKPLPILVVCTLFGAVACEETTHSPPPGTYPAPEVTSPVNALKNVEISFNRGDAGLLDRVLSEDFTFHFDERDVGQHPPDCKYVIPASWSYGQFRQAVISMYDRAYAVNAKISTSAVGEPEENQTDYWAGEVDISLLVMVTELNGFIAENGYCDFEFEVYYNEYKQKRWRLTGWRDHTSENMDAYPGVAPTSLGRILGMYNVGG